MKWFRKSAETAQGAAQETVQGEVQEDQWLVRITFKDGSWVERKPMTRVQAAQSVDEIEGLLKSKKAWVRWRDQVFKPSHVLRVGAFTLQPQ